MIQSTFTLYLHGISMVTLNYFYFLSRFQVLLNLLPLRLRDKVALACNSCQHDWLRHTDMNMLNLELEIVCCLLNNTRIIIVFMRLHTVRKY